MVKKINDEYNYKVNISISLLFCILVFVFAPLELYLSNKDYFFFDGIEIIKYTIPIGVICFIVMGLVLFILKKKSSKLWSCLITFIFSVALLLYIQGDFRIIDYGVLDGSVIDWKAHRIDGVIDALLWLFVLVCIFWLRKWLAQDKFLKCINIVSVCLIMVQISTLAVLLFSSNGIFKEDHYESTKINEFDFSEEENYIVVMLDSYDATILSDILNEDNSEKYRDILRDFTFYPNTTGMYSYTALAVPYILTGEEYLNDCTYGEYLEKAYKKSPMLKALQANNWNIDLYNITTLPQDGTIDFTRNCKLIHNTVSSHKRLLGYYYKLLAFRYLPQQFKPYFWFYADEIEEELKINEEGYDIFAESNFKFDRDGSDITTHSEGKNFKFYTLFGAHQPYYMTADFEDAEEGTDIYEASKGVLVMVDRFLNRLREEGVYDNSTIIFLADHGIQKRFNPLLLIKYKDEKNQFQENEVAFSYDNLQDIFTGLVDGNGKDETERIMNSKIIENRRFLSYDHSSNFGYNTYFEDIHECVITDKDNILSMEETGVVYSAK